MFLCRGTETSAGSSVQGGGRDDALGLRGAPFPWVDDAVLHSVPNSETWKLWGHLGKEGAVRGVGPMRSKLLGAPRRGSC